MKDFRNLLDSLTKDFRDKLVNTIAFIASIINVYLINYRSTYLNIRNILNFIIIRIKKYYNVYY